MAAAPAASTPVTATPASGPPYTEQSSMPAATQNTNTATGAATLGIMSAFGIQQTPTAAPSQFQSQAINIPVAGGTTSSTKWSGGESNFVINGADMGGLNSEFRRRLESMAAEYKEKTGKKINVSGARSAYRSYAQQVAIAKTARPGYAATPGTSNHGFGFALDINTADANKAESLGLLQKYGLHRPMMSKSLYEPWHIEPVGLNKAALAQYRAKRQSGQFTGDQLAFALSGSGSAGPPYTEQSVMPVAGIAATPAASGVAMTSSSISDTMAASSATVPNTEAGSSGGGFGFGGLFSGISNIFTSSSPSVQSTEGGIANLSTSSTPSPMPAMGAESSITSKMDDIASKHINKVNEEITVMKGIDASIKELTKQINALSRITINNVSGGDSKTSITSANIPDTESRLKPQTGGGFLSGKMFGFG
jgi:hypothetical protein